MRFFNDFLEILFNGEDHGVSFSRSLRFESEADVRNSLKRYRDDDMRILFGFFGPEDARSILCEVRECTCDVKFYCVCESVSIESVCK